MVEIKFIYQINLNSLDKFKIIKYTLHINYIGEKMKIFDFYNNHFIKSVNSLLLLKISL